MKGLLKTIFDKINNKRLPILWLEYHYDDIPSYSIHVNPTLNNDEFVGGMIKDLVSYLKKEYDTEDYL